VYRADEVLSLSQFLAAQSLAEAPIVSAVAAKASFAVIPRIALDG